MTKWISSLGGPFVFGSERTMTRWMGGDGLSLPVADPAYSLFRPQIWGEECDGTDYAWACGGEPAFLRPMPGYGPGEEIVVICEPDDVAWFPSSDRSGRLVQWEGADSAEQVWQHVSRLEAHRFDQPPIKLTISDASMVIFDSVMSLQQASAANDVLRLGLAEGKYEVFSLHYEEPSITLKVFDIRSAR